MQQSGQIENRQRSNEPLLLEAAVGVEILAILTSRFLLNLDPVASGAVGLAAGAGSRAAVSALAGIRRVVEVTAEVLNHPVS